MYCSSCGEEVAEGSSFCSSCGADIDPVSEPSPQEDAPGQQVNEETASAGATVSQGSSGAGNTGAANPQPTAASGEQAGQAEAAGGLDENVAGTLSYVLGFVTGIVFLLIEDDNEFVRFHAAQSIVVFGALFVLGWGLSLLQGILGLSGIAYVGWMLAAILGLAGMFVSLVALVLWIMLMVKAYNGERYALPIAGGLAENLA